MRIIGGNYRGRALATLRGQSLRPTGERLRQSFFDVLGDSVRDVVFVDCYAGSGVVGLEALSRGAARVFLIEESEAAQRLISRNLESLGFPRNAVLVGASVRRGLRRLAAEGVRAHFCFLDPPYDRSQERRRTLRWLAAGELMELQGSLIVQHNKKDPPPDALDHWRRARILTQGSNALSFYCYLESEP